MAEGLGIRVSREADAAGRGPGSPRPSRLVVIGAAALGAAGMLAFDQATAPLTQPLFCASCHEMEKPHATWRESPHFANRAGVQVTCTECHLPHRDDRFRHLAARVWSGGKDLSMHLLGRYDPVESREAVLQTLPSGRCLKCHANLAVSPGTSAVMIVHATALAHTSGRAHACVTCHDALHGPRPLPPPPKTYEPENNSYCQVCHINFADEEFTTVHVKAGVGCTKCHGDSDEHAADEEHLTPPSLLYSKARLNDSCMASDCHPRAAMEAEIGHRPFFAGADPEHAWCTDCHGRHMIPKRTRRWDKDTRQLIEVGGIAISPTNPAPSRATEAGPM